MKIDREKVFNKYDQHCGYCGKKFSSIKDMQVDHIRPRCLETTEFYIHDESNLMPSCKRCNHYKRSDGLEQFRKKMMTLHERIEKQYIDRVAIDFGIITLTPFDGIFYFEKVSPLNNESYK